MKRYDMFLALWAIFMLFSCTEEGIGTPQFEIIPVNDLNEFVMGPQETSLTDATGLKVFIYSNQPWSVSLDFEGQENAGWATVYPDHGDNDGRFFINVAGLSEAYPRTCILNVTNSMTGNILYSGTFRQNGVDAVLNVSETLLSYGYANDTKTITVDSNVNWIVKVMPKEEGDDVSWCIPVISSDMRSCRVECMDNDGDYRRYAVLRFCMDGNEALYRDVEIVQLPEYRITNAELKTIAEVLSMPDGVIEDNYKVQGYVISDKSSCNMPNDTDMYIQDDSGTGMIVGFTSPEEYRYALDDKVTVWLTGAQFVTEDGVRKLSSVSSSNIVTETTLTGDKAVPVDITDVSRIDDYRNTLVRIRGAYFATPYGTICNVGTWQGDAACKYGFANILDRNGNKATMRTMTSFPEKWDLLLTDEEYEIVAIVTADKGEMMWVDGVPGAVRLRGETYNNTLRIRKISDISPTGEESRYRRVVYWQGISTSGSSWKPAFGEGTFDIKAGIEDGTRGKMTDAEKSRISYCLRYNDRDFADASCWKGYSTKSFWDPGYGGYYYECSTSAADVSGDLFLTFVMGNFGAAGRYWKVQYSFGGDEWIDIPDGRFELWNMLSNTGDTSRLYASQNFVFRIPDAAGHDTVTARITTKGQENRCSDGRDRGVTNTSSTCLYYFGFVERR